MIVLTGVIDSHSFIPCLELLAWVGDVQLDEELRDALQGGLLNTDWDSDRRYELPLCGLEVSVARDDEGYVAFRVTYPQEDIQTVELALHVATRYRMVSK